MRLYPAILVLLLACSLALAADTPSAQSPSGPEPLDLIAQPGIGQDALVDAMARLPWPPTEPSSYWTSIANDEQIMLLRNRFDRGNIHAMTKKMNWKNSFGFFSDLLFDLRYIDTIGNRINIDKHWLCTKVPRRFCSSNERERRRDHFISLPNACCT